MGLISSEATKQRYWARKMAGKYKYILQDWMKEPTTPPDKIVGGKSKTFKKNKRKGY